MRVDKMADEQPPSAAPWVPPRLTIPALIKASKGCRGCHLYENADPNSLRRGSSGSSCDPGWRTTGRPGRRSGASVRRPGGQAPGQGAGGSRGGPVTRLRYERRQAFQVRAAREAAYTSEADRRRDPGMLSVARSRNGCDPAGSGCMPGRNRCSGTTGPGLSSDSGSWPVFPASAREMGDGHHSPFSSFAYA